MGAVPALALEADPGAVEPVTQSAEQQPQDTAPDAVTVETPAPVPVPEVPETPAEDPAAQQPAAEEAPAPEAAETAAPITEEAVVEQPAVSADAPPYVRWTATSPTGEALPGSTFVIDGPRDPAIPVTDANADDTSDANDEAAWTGAQRTTVLDNAGQPDYVGPDLDPIPGSLLVKSLVSDADVTVTHEVAASERFRVRPVAADGYVVAESAAWLAVSSAETAEQPVAELTLQPLEATEPEVVEPEVVEPEVVEPEVVEPEVVEPEVADPEGKAPQENTRATTSEDDVVISPLVANTPDGAPSPFAYWNVVDTNGVKVSGASFNFQRRSGNDWVSFRTITDCTSGTCTVIDRDNDPGEFLAKWISSETPGANPTGTGAANVIQANARYRIQPANPPQGYVWTGGLTGWVDSNSLTTPPLGWSGAANDRTLNFGTFELTAVNYAPVCVAGNIYGIQAGGQIRHLDPANVISNLGNPSGVADANFNGLGIGLGGTPTFAFNRGGTGNSDSNVSIYRYSSLNGNWSDTNVNVDSTAGGAVTFVAGAVNLDTGRYFLGGFAGDGGTRVFRLWEYNPTTNASVYKGSVSAAGGGSANGDIAFDVNGNLFIVRGSGTTTTVYSVTAANLAAASGGVIPSAAALPVTGTTPDVNGVAFGADGYGYLGNGDTVQRYNMPGWTNQTSVVPSGLSTSTDLASCGSPPTITIEKVVEGGRVIANTDQVTLTLTQGATVIGTATTTGNAVGLQPQRVGPLPTVRNVPLTFTETAAGTTNLNNYVSSYRCLVDGVQTVQGNGTSGTITIPASGQSVNCQFYNAPLIAQVNIHKDVTGVDGLNPTPRAGWTVGSVATATTGTITGATGNPPTTTTTNASGNASWTYRFGAKPDVATISVNELLGTDHTFQSGSCVVTHLDGTQTPIILTGPAAAALTGIVPGDRVDCGYVNRLRDTTLTLVKAVDSKFGGNAAITVWTLAAAGPTTGVTGVTGNTAITNRSVTAGTYTLSESGGPSGYTPRGWVCTNAGVGGTIGVVGSVATIPVGAIVTCTITNADLPGSVEWTKVDPGGTLLSGSEWTLTGPAGFANMNLTEANCTGGPGSGSGTAPYCTYTAVGQFAVANLPWGTYSLEETKAPAGYIRDTEQHSFTITGSALEGVLAETTNNAIVNRPIPSPELPLSGGIGSDFFSIMGAGVLAIGMATASVLMVRSRRKEVG